MNFIARKAFKSLTLLLSASSLYDLDSPLSLATLQSYVYKGTEIVFHAPQYASVNKAQQPRVRK